MLRPCQELVRAPPPRADSYTSLADLHILNTWKASCSCRSCYCSCWSLWSCRANKRIQSKWCLQLWWECPVLSNAAWQNLIGRTDTWNQALQRSGDADVLLQCDRNWQEKGVDDWESCTAKMLQELQCPAHCRLRALKKGMDELKNWCQTKITGYFSAP